MPGLSLIYEVPLIYEVDFSFRFKSPSKKSFLYFSIFGLAREKHDRKSSYVRGNPLLEVKEHAK